MRANGQRRLAAAGAPAPALPAVPRTAVPTVTYVLFVVMAGGTLPTPVYALYVQRLHLSPPVVALVFAAYAVGIVAALLLFGGLSDKIGRRATLVPALVVAAASSVVFIALPTLPGLFAGRLLSGVSVGLTTGAATAYLRELHPSPPRAALIASVTNMAGLGSGALLSGVLVEYAPSPEVLPYTVLIVLLLPGAALVLLPERVVARGGGIRPQRIGVPPAVRRPFAAAAVAVFASFALLGLLAALAGNFLVQGLHNHSHLAVGLVAFSAFGSAGAAQLLAGRMTPRAGLVAGMTAVPLGLALIVTGLSAASLPVFLCGSVLGGAGAGTSFKSGLALVTSQAAPDRVSELVSGYFVAAYLGLTVPVVGVAVLLAEGTLMTAAGVFAGVVTVLCLGSIGVTAALGNRTSTRRTPP
ncbi:MFS transporter [Streptomyces roseifaciens]|uniref:MFS transporter n=1 Tax=Streptomyces roseifaciens TaxID=1488406 RepID=UPI000717E9D0|nr:MFS transporter [Streptomyces roseifaciens]